MRLELIEVMKAGLFTLMVMTGFAIMASLYLAKPPVEFTTSSTLAPDEYCGWRFDRVESEFSFNGKNRRMVYSDNGRLTTLVFQEELPTDDQILQAMKDECTRKREIEAKRKTREAEQAERRERINSMIE